MTAERASSLPFGAGSISFPSYYKLYFCLQRFFLAAGMFITFFNCHSSGTFFIMNYAILFHNEFY